MRYDYLIVGAGFAGCVCAEQLAKAGKSVLLIDKRPHIGGNAYDVLDKYGLLIHPYGPHIFHTNSKRIFEYLSQFTTWRFYEHRVLAMVDGKHYPIPINRTTINRLYNQNLSEDGVQTYLERVRESRPTVANSEDVVVNTVGRDLCDKFFSGYTRKQWGIELRELSAGVAARIPVRTNDDDRYFTDTYQFMPADGYSAMFSRMLENDSIIASLNTEFKDVAKTVSWQHLIYTGPIDDFFGHCFGRLPYRSLIFKHKHFSHIQKYQPTGTINFPNEHSYTRITEFKYLTGDRHPGTSIVFEYPCAGGEPYYPIPCPSNEKLYGRYVELSKQFPGVSFVGRLAEYRYYNMDQVIAAALKCAEKLINA